MVPQGLELVNTQYITNLTKAVNGASTCAALQGVVTSAMESINAVKAGIQSELNKLSPFLILLTVPVTPQEIKDWMKAYVEGYLKQQLKPILTYVDQLNALVAQVAALEAAIAAAAASLTHCSITLPSLTMPTLPPPSSMLLLLPQLPQLPALPVLNLHLPPIPTLPPLPVLPPIPPIPPLPVLHLPAIPQF